MFSEACRGAGEYSRLLVTSVRRQDGSIETSLSTFIVLNREGWVVTAGHVFDSFKAYNDHQKKIKEINELNGSRVSRPGSPDVRVKADPKLIANHSFWWGWDGVRINNVYVNRQLDVAVGRLEGFNPDWVRTYPVLRDPEGVRPGTSLCRAGFPLIAIKSEWDPGKSAFRIPRLKYGELIFFNEGVHSRTIDRGVTKADNYRMRYVETSTPGLRGQSGGPIFDREGRLYAMQVATESVPMNIRPTVEYEGSTVVEHQFLNVGVGVHVGSIRDVLDSRGIRYDAEGDESGYRIVGRWRPRTGCRRRTPRRSTASSTAPCRGSRAGSASGWRPAWPCGRPSGLCSGSRSACGTSSSP